MTTYLKKAVFSDVASDETLKRSENEYNDFVSNYIEGFVGNLYSDGIVDVIDSETVTEWLSNPDAYWEEIQNFMAYLYYSDGNIYQLYTILRTLPDLNYSISVIDTSLSANEKNLNTINTVLRKVKYKELCRDIISQLCVSGTVICTWLGDKKNPYLHIFSKNQYVFPKYRVNGEWVAVLDLAWIDAMDEETERPIWFETLKGIISESDYNKYLADSSNDEVRYIELPIETTKVLRVNTLFRDQRIGFPMGTQYIGNYLHKKSFLDLEKTIANKVIKNVAMLTIGNDKLSYNDINKSVRKKVSNGVYNTLKKTISTSSTPLAVLPEWAKLQFADIDGLDGLNDDKYNELDDDISKDLGIPSPMLTGMDGNSASMKYSFIFLYKRLGEMLEQIDDVFNKMFFVLFGKKSDNYWMEIDKNIPLDPEKVLSALQGLHAEGFAFKPIVDMLPDVSYQQFVNQSISEQESGIYDIVKPPLTSYTRTSSDDNEGNKKSDIDLSDEGVKSRDGNKNEI